MEIMVEFESYWLNIIGILNIVIIEMSRLIKENKCYDVEKVVNSIVYLWSVIGDEFFEGVGINVFGREIIDLGFYVIMGG